MKRLAFVAVVFSVWLAGPVLAQPRGSVMLRWDWAEGKVLEYDTMQEMRQVITGYNEQDVSWTISYRVRQEVESVDADGVATVKQTYTSGRVIAVEKGGERVEYDSKDPRDKDKAGHRLIKPYAAFIGKTIMFQADPEGKVRSLEGASAILADAFQRAVDANPLADPFVAMFKASLNDESMRKALEQQLRVVPGSYVRVRDTWSVEAEQQMPLVGTLTNVTDYRVARLRRGRDGQTAEIEASGRIEQSDGGTGVLAALADVELIESKAEGSVSFSVEGGHIAASDMRLVMVFRIDLAAGLGLEDTVMEQRFEQRARMDLVSASMP